MRKISAAGIILGLLLMVFQPAFADQKLPADKLLSHPTVVTRDDNGAVAVLQVGETLAVKLGETPPEWEVQVSDPSVLQRMIQIMVARGVQGVFKAEKPGTAVISATGYFPCQREQPFSCKIASPQVTTTVLVMPARANKAVFTVGQTTYSLNGETGYIDGSAFIQNGRTYVPVRYLAKALGVADADVTWVADQQAVQLKLDGAPVAVQVGSNRLQVGDLSLGMDVSTTMRGDRTYVPLRWVAEALGYRVSWDAERQAATIEP